MPVRSSEPGPPCGKSSTLRRFAHLPDVCPLWGQHGDSCLQELSLPLRGLTCGQPGNAVALCPSERRRLRPHYLGTLHFSLLFCILRLFIKDVFVYDGDIFLRARDSVTTKGPPRAPGSSPSRTHCCGRSLSSCDTGATWSSL